MCRVLVAEIVRLKTKVRAGMQTGTFLAFNIRAIPFASILKYRVLYYGCMNCTECKSFFNKNLFFSFVCSIFLGSSALMSLISSL